ncbi:IspD/TarI family cytidylyltransferase [Mycolicibacterium lacusdiani]|uniref:IspD/TarI family cytidylyltransferase n=1 Tax=Mycolicibacterium lacusdiani TaxID=2895283 RepID=UPI001F0230F3|nr:2-C-methyl-D-erythritol 4-phosphate cytidylyltransferase [Mycolicibacterium lacusdiani]
MNPTATEPCAIVPVDATVERAALFCVVAGEPALLRVLRALLGDGRVPARRIVVVAQPELIDDIAAATADAGLAEIAIIAGDATRVQCLRRGLEHLDPGPDAALLVHDHRCPLASAAVTDRVLGALAEGHAVVAPVLQMTDTVKQVDETGAVVDTIDRQALRTVQHPRGYRAATLASLLNEDDDEFTSALTSGTPIETVTGDGDAITADLPADAALLDAVLAARSG